MESSQVSGKNVTVILNGYKRPHVLKEQYEAYKNQSVGEPEFMFWGNLSPEYDSIPFDKDVIDNCRSAISGGNMGVWARFAFALNAQTDFICVADDDTIPGQNWLENCLNTSINEIKKPSVLTTRGVVIKDNDYPAPDSYEAFGWCQPNEETKKVDFGGHCWFFHKQLLGPYWMFAPLFLPLNFGEDMHLSFAAWKAGGIETFTPPHPADKPEMWGSIKERALDYGQDAVATSRLGDANQGMKKYYDAIIQGGYVAVKDRENV